MTEPMTRPQTREQWLELAVLKLRPLFDEIGVTLPAVRVSVGWPSKGGTRSKNKVIGQCWKSCVANDGVPQLFISPVLKPTEPIKVLATLVHELIHAADDCESGHGGKKATKKNPRGKGFRGMATALGLTGKMSATVCEEDSELADRFRALIAEIGTYPHCAINLEEVERVAGEKKQTTRMLKLEAPDCGFLVRTTAKWLDQEGFPKCPHGIEMELA